MLDRGDEGEQVIAGLEERMALLEEAIEDKEQTYVVLRTMDTLDTIQVFTTSNFGASHLDELGLSMPDEVLTPEEAEAESNAFWYPLSVEALPDVDADHIFLLARWEPEVQEEFLANPLWQSLKAVQEERVHFIEGEYWVRSHPLASHRVLDDLFTYLAGVDPAGVAPNPFAHTY